MQRIALNVTMRLTYSPHQGFSSMLTNRESNPIKERVMSTPTWPVPYYQRLHKAYPVRENKQINLSNSDYSADDAHWYSAKMTLNETLKGRQIVEHTENHIKTNTYLIEKEDCESMAKAYVDDIGQFLDIANRENLRILKGKSLI